MLTATIYDTHVEQLFDRIQQLHQLLTAAGVPYRIVGGMAVFIHVSERDPLCARLTSDVDAALERRNLPVVIEAARKVGWVYRHVAGIDMLVEAAQPRARSAVHLFVLDEKVPASPAVETREGILVAPVADLVKMKLTSYRLKDRVHIRDLDGVGLIDAEMETGLPEVLRQRLAEIRASE